MNTREAEAQLETAAAVIPYAEGGMSYIKELVIKCLDADIPAAAGRAPGTGKG
jgi:hypothetical protein